MPESIVIYERLGVFEPGSRYYFPIQVIASGAQALADELADAQRALVCNNVAFSRWEHLNASGSVVNEGSLGNVLGSQTGNMQPFKYCLLLRLLTDNRVEKASTKFIHGFPDDFFVDGVPTAGFLTLVAVYAGKIASLGTWDSDGQTVTDVVFRTFSRRRKIRMSE